MNQKLCNSDFSLLIGEVKDGDVVNEICELIISKQNKIYFKVLICNAIILNFIFFHLTEKIDFII